MSYYYVDFDSGSNSNNGTTMHLAWKTLEYAMERTALTTNDKIFVRRGMIDTVAGDIVPATSNPKPYRPLEILCWPRSELYGSAYFSQGLRLVTGSSFNINKYAHSTRLLHAHESDENYIISHPSGNIDTIESSSFFLSENYKGETGTSYFTISADGFYATSNTFGAGEGANSKSQWDADSHNLPIADFNGTYYLQMRYESGWILSNLFLRNSNSSNNLLYLRDGYGCIFNGLIIEQTGSANTYCVYNYAVNTNKFNRCQFRGRTTNQAGAQYLVYNYLTPNMVYEDCTFLGGDDGFIGVDKSPIGTYINCSFGLDIESPAIKAPIRLVSDLIPQEENIFIDCEFDGYTNCYDVLTPSNFSYSVVKFENFNRILYNNQSTIRRLGSSSIVYAESGGEVEKRSGGSNYVIKTDYGSSWGSYYYTYLYPKNYISGSSELLVPKILKHYFNLPKGSWRIIYYCQCTVEIADTSKRIWAECSYIKNYVNESNYKKEIMKSTNTLAKNIDTADWSQYISVDFTIPIDSKVECCIFCSSDTDNENIK
jgi:hypothetical protein